MTKRTAVLWGILAGILTLAGCKGQPGDFRTVIKNGRPESDSYGYEDPQPGRQGNSAHEGGEPLRVAATLFPYYDFTRQIAGDLVELELIVPAGMDSHSFEPTPADMRKIQDADVLICNGGAMEHWVSQVLEAVDRRDMTVVYMMDYVDAVEEELVEGMEEGRHGHGSHGGHGHEEQEGEMMSGVGPDGSGDEREDSLMPGGGPDSPGSRTVFGDDHDGHEMEIEYDEHIWTSPVNAMVFAQVIQETLSQKDPAHEEQYRLGREAFQDQLMEIHQGFLQVARDRKRNMIVVGDKFPFRYLADEYGFSYRAAFTGCSTDTEPSAKTIAYLIDKVRDEKIPAVYYLELSSRRVSEIIGEETGAVPLLLHSCHNVTRREFESGVTYVELMKQNVENLRKGLDE